MLIPSSGPTTKRRLTYGWHFFRASAYGAAMFWPLAFVFHSVGETSFHTRVAMNPRLADLLIDVRQNFQKAGKESPYEIFQRAGLGTPAQASTSKSQEGLRWPTGRANHGTESWGGERGGGSSQSAQGFEPTDAGFAASGPRSKSAPRTHANTSGDSFAAGDADDGSPFDPDDASPVAASAKRSETKPASTRSSGSAWDRVRQGAFSSEKKNWEEGDSSGLERGWAHAREDKTSVSREASPKSDEFSYSREDEERERREYDKEQAQKEFDAMVEAERQGLDGASGRGNQRK